MANESDSLSAGGADGELAGLAMLPARSAQAHKGTAGRVTVVGGCCAGASRMVGAPAFSALGALRSGCGLVTLLTPEPITVAVLTLVPSATAVALRVDADGELLASEAVAAFDAAIDTSNSVVIGPGMGLNGATQALALRAVKQEECPVVIDADALNALAQVPNLNLDFHARAILTPHPGEFQRLAKSLRVPGDPIDQTKRPRAAEHLARRLGCIVVLKGFRTVVSDGLRTWVCERGHPCLATGGSGDVLAGVVAGLVAQHPPARHNPYMAQAAARLSPVLGGGTVAAVPDLFELACLGVQAHAIAGEEWARTRGASAGLVVQELADLLPQSVEGLRVGS